MILRHASATARQEAEGHPAQGAREGRWAPGQARRVAMFGGLAVALIAVFLLDLALGSVAIPLSEVASILTGGEPAKPSWSTIVLAFRLPKALTATLAGAALAVAGLQMQTLFRNPLADPYILGINAGASLGVGLVVLASGTASGFLSNLGLVGDLSLILAAIAGAGLITGLIIVAARWLRHSLTLLILGLMLGYATSAVVNILISFSAPEQIQAYLSWTFGSFGGVSWRQLALLAPVIGGGLLLAWLMAKPLDALLLGEAYARSMGAQVPRLRFLLIAGTSVLAGAVTAFCGPIAFLGVAIPHLGRALLRTADHRRLVPATMLLGALAALLADLLAGLPGDHGLLPLNAVTALLGAPVVIWILWRQRADFAT